MVNVTSFTWLGVKLPPGTVVNQHSFPANIAGLIPPASPLCPTHGTIKTMAAHKDDVDFDWVPSKDEIEEILCVLAGSDPENCSYSRVSRSRGPSFLSVCICSFTREIRVINELKSDDKGALTSALCRCVDRNKFYLSIVHWGNGEFLRPLSC